MNKELIKAILKGEVAFLLIYGVCFYLGYTYPNFFRKELPKEKR